MPDSYRGILVGLMVANLFLVCIYEYFIVNKSGDYIKKTVTGKDMDANVVGKEIDPEA
jgi:uncharacterized membrane protein